MNMSAKNVPYICLSCLRYLTCPRRPISIKRRSPGWGKLTRNFAHTNSQSFRLAVIGSGPAGFYAAGKVLKDIDNAVVDMYEHLPVPFGLVRYGVAPDHPEVKNCQDRFEEIAASSNFNFIGNIRVGRDVPLSILKPHYDAILLAYGASEDKELRIPGENLDGVYSARAFVGWYNGLPDFADLQPRLDSGSDAVIIGQGNVALDVARILLSPVDRLRMTDTPEYALEALSHSRIRNVRVVGRRGPMQAAFTIKEARELIHLPNTTFTPIPRSLFPPDLSTLPRPKRRLAELLLNSGRPAAADDHNRITLSFLLSPTSFNADPTNPKALTSITLDHNAYTDPKNLSVPNATVSPAADTPPLTLPAATAFRSIGYHAAPLPCFSTLGIPFDTRTGTIPNVRGRVVSPADTGDNRAIPGLYTAGWLKRGPTGVIASTMADAFESAEAIAADVAAGVAMLNAPDLLAGRAGWDAVSQEVRSRGLRATSWEDWRVIDAIERERGRQRGKVREKVVDVGEMMGFLDSVGK